MNWTIYLTFWAGTLSSDGLVALWNEAQGLHSIFTMEGLSLARANSSFPFVLNFKL